MFSGTFAAILNSDGDDILLVNVTELEYCRHQRSLCHRVNAGLAILDRGLVITNHSYHCSVPPYIQVHCHQTTIVTTILRRQAARFHSQVAALATGTVAATAIINANWAQLRTEAYTEE